MRALHAARLFTLLFLGLAAHAAFAGASEEPMTLDTPTGKLAGTLQLPPTGAKVPIALIIAGSGPTDRDGNTMGAKVPSNNLKMLATALADAGIATLRYDKRGVAASAPAAPPEADMRFDTYVDDATAWVEKLKSDPRFSSVLVIGHSEGSLVGMIAAQRAGAAAYVSISGAAQSVSDILRKQLAGQLPPELAAENERILKSIERGELAGAVPPALAAFYRPSVQPYLISWLKYVPAERIVALKMPVLIVQGTTDVQVGVEQAQALQAARPGAQLAIIPGMNHVLKLVPADMNQQIPSYTDPTLPLAPQLIAVIVKFVNETAILHGHVSTK